MSQKTAKRIRRLEGRVDAMERNTAAWDAAEAAVHNQAAFDVAAERRRARQAERTAAMWRRMVYAALVAAIIVEIIAITVINVKADDADAIDPPAGVTVAESAKAAAVDLLVEEPENERIEAALLKRSHVIEDCEVTWYTEDTCGKAPDDPAYGITRSGLPVVEHLTCAVDPNVIPLYSDVFVEYADGTVEQLWATDIGVKGNALDIYTPDYDYAIQCGRQHLTVWWVEPED